MQFEMFNSWSQLSWKKVSNGKTLPTNGETINKENTIKTESKLFLNLAEKNIDIAHDRIHATYPQNSTSKSSWPRVILYIL